MTLLALVLPLGISFFTFHQIGYQIDRFRGQASKHNFIDYALFVTFFPQLIAGPIVRQYEFLPQLHGFAKKLGARNLLIGLTIFSIGLFKKVIFADSFALYATPVFDSAAKGVALDGQTAWLGVLAYTFQIYFDFSGYSDMAIGLARMVGINLPLNFNAPYRVDLDHRFLAALAHHARALPARLSLLPARRQPRWRRCTNSPTCWW